MTDRIPTYTLAKAMSIMADQIANGDAVSSATVHLVSRRLIELRRLLGLASPAVFEQQKRDMLAASLGEHQRYEINPLVDLIKTELAN